MDLVRGSRDSRTKLQTFEVEFEMNNNIMLLWYVLMFLRALKYCVNPSLQQIKRLYLQRNSNEPCCDYHCKLIASDLN